MPGTPFADWVAPVPLEPVVSTVPVTPKGHPAAGCVPPAVGRGLPSGAPAYPPAYNKAEPPPPPATASITIEGLVKNTADAPPPPLATFAVWPPTVDELTEND